MPTDAEYPNQRLYYVASAEAGAYPFRQGDLFPPLAIGEQKWFACQLVHPTCELKKPSVKQVQVVRVRPLTALADDAAKSRVTAGLEEVDGELRVAYANTFFLAPVAGSDTYGQPMFSDFREVALVDRQQLMAAERVAAMSHDRPSLRRPTPR